MNKRREPVALVLLMVVAALAVPSTAVAQASTHSARKFPLWAFDQTQRGCRAKGRLQDKYYCSSKVMDEVIAGGKDSIPVLISQLTESRKTRTPIYDYWSYTTSGDIAYFLLSDLFTDSDWKTFNMPGLESLRHDCGDTGEFCWRQFLREHGRKFVQEKWLAAWNANKQRVYWNEESRCFRLRPKVAGLPEQVPR